MFCYTAHYRSPLMFSWDGLRAAAQGLANMKKLIAADALAAAGKAADEGIVDTLLRPFWEALCDDCNMPLAMGSLWNVLHDKTISAAEKCRAIERADSILALDLLKHDEAALNIQTINTGHVRYELVSKKAVDPATSEKIMGLISARNDAKLRKDYAAADAIRGQLREIGVEVKDLPGGKIQCIVNEK